jgi:hypothetical protein
VNVSTNAQLDGPRVTDWHSPVRFPYVTGRIFPFAVPSIQRNAVALRFRLSIGPIIGPR